MLGPKIFRAGRSSDIPLEMAYTAIGLHHVSTNPLNPAELRQQAERRELALVDELDDAERLFYMRHVRKTLDFWKSLSRDVDSVCEIVDQKTTTSPRDTGR